MVAIFWLVKGMLSNVGYLDPPGDKIKFLVGSHLPGILGCWVQSHRLDTACHPRRDMSLAFEQVCMGSSLIA